MRIQKPGVSAQRVLFMGPPSAVDCPPNASASHLLARMGKNTGNLLIGDAVRRQLDVASFVRLPELLQRGERTVAMRDLDPAGIEAEFDVIVIGAANFLHAKFDFADWASLVESVRLPCVILGLGAQAKDYGYPVEIPAGTRRLVQAVAARSTTVGVRGRFTAEVVASLGVTNVRIVGCPSMYWSCEPALHFKTHRSEGALKIAVNGSANVVEHAVDELAARRVEVALARLSLERGCSYVLQNETELIDMVLGTVPTDPSLLVNLARQYGLESLAPSAFAAFVQRQMQVFWDIPAWFSAIATTDFVIGTRFHGCLAAVLSGVPAHVFVHDARTREMCELLRLPHSGVCEVESIDVDALYNSLDLDATTTAHRTLYGNYRAFLDENDLPHRLAR